MWELDYKESWVPKNWCFWTVVLEKTLENPLDFKEIQLVHPKGGQSWVFIGRSDVEAEAPVLWPPHERADSSEKTLMLGKDWGQEEKGTTEDEMVGCITNSMDMGLGRLRQLLMDREASCAVVHGVTKSRTRLSDWIELNSVYSCHLFLISSASVRSLPFLSFIEPIFAWNVPLVSLIFLKTSLVSHSIFFLCFFALITEEGLLIPPCYSLELCI